MRHSRITRRLARSAAAGRRAARALSGRGERPAPVAAWRAEPSDPAVVAVVGDSLAARFPASLLNQLHPRILRRGHPGETAVALHARIAEVLERHPSAVVLQTGTNDLLRGATVDALLATYAALLDACRTATPDTAIVVLSLPPVTPARLDPDTLRAANAGLRTLATDRAAVFVDTHTALADPNGCPAPGTTTDGVHLTHHGYRLVAVRLTREIEAADLEEHTPPLTCSAPSEP